MSEYDRNLTFAVPEGWWSLVKQGIGKCQQPKFAKYWEKGWTDRLWDCDNLGPDREEADDFAANLCTGCPIIEQCLEAALMEEGDLSARMRSQIRGGKTPVQRAEMRLEIQINPMGRPRRTRAELEKGCGLDHAGDCSWFEAPNGSQRCRIKANAEQRAMRAKRKEAA